MAKRKKANGGEVEGEVEGVAPIVRSSAGLRDALFDEFDSLRNGTSDPARARRQSFAIKW